MRILLPTMLLLTVAACAQTPRDLERKADANAAIRAALDTELAGLTPGKPQNCLDQFRLRNIDVKAYGDVLLYRAGADLAYVNRTGGGCERVGEDSILVTQTPSTQLCRGDIARTVSRVGQFTDGSCSFGEFVPYTRAR